MYELIELTLIEHAEPSRNIREKEIRKQIDHRIFYFDNIVHI